MRRKTQKPNDARRLTSSVSRLTSEDAAQREQALDPERSFLVQAPAGSGKTELLTQRFLRLLAAVDEPEEVVALTFTRKAAGEMRARIVRALAAAGEPMPEAAHERRTHELARAAAARSAERGWALAEQPSRLRIQTLDALCASITRQMPVSSAFGAQPAIAREPERLYREAARRTLDELEHGHHWSRAIERLLLHLGNDLGRVEALLADMLARRDQWLRFVADRGHPRTQRDNLEAALAQEVERALARAAAAIPPTAVAALAELARFAARNLRRMSPGLSMESPIAGLHTLRDLPGTAMDDLGRWRGISELLLTRDGGWRRQVTKAQGFPPKGDAPDPGEAARYQAMKEAHAELVAILAAAPGACRALAAVPALPPVAYREDQWQVAAALFELLKLAAAHLQVVFGERGEVDFAEMAARAERALGGPEAPSDLALALDYRIAHLLVDEFQDTSLTQFRLLERLVAGWQPDDGRSLFLVGDPMQSIYRFRQAEVGLFLHAAEHGLSAVPLNCLRLTANFRSQAGLIEWVNRVFADVMPARENAATGAISFSPAEAQRPAVDGPAVSLHGFDGLDPDAEAGRVVQLIRQARDERPAARVAVLVRSRRHAARLMPCLRAASMRFQAVELEALGSRPVVQDLLALTRCLLHPADRLNWLAILRAPWCGLTLADLAAIAGEGAGDGIWPRLNDPEVREALSEDGRERVGRLCETLLASLTERSRRPLRRWVEGVWLTLGGPAAVAEPAALSDAAAYFDLLEAVEEGGDLADFGLLTERVDALFAPPDAQADERLQIMTLHKAKGLEFDVVIVPGLGRRGASDRQPLLFWLELPRARRAGAAGEGADLLLAPIAAAGESGEPIYSYLKRLDREKTVLEDGRLLYVAATRARERLHLLGHLPEGRDRPESGSPLACLWPAVGEEFAAGTAPAPEIAGPAVSGPPAMRRLRRGWQPPAPPRGVVAPVAPQPATAAPVAFDWAGREARHVGTVVHQVLMRIARDGLDVWTDRRLRQRQSAIAGILGTLGVAPRRAEELAGRVAAAVVSALADERGRWLLSAHEDGRSEYALTGLLDGRPVNFVIDRTFVDADGVRWIVDYKTGRHEGGDIEAFLDREQERYREQLQAYATLFALREQRPIRLGLYFPMLCGWREWERRDSGAPGP